jgi:hypothetical protein
MNIDCVERVIIPELHWNNAAMSQYYCRFIRYTSLTEKPVYFLVYESSIEMNLFKMVLMKEKLNLFMKNQDLDEDEVYERFGIDDPRILQNLMYKEKTKDGVEIRWGEQDITSVATPTQIAFDDLMAG